VPVRRWMFWTPRAGKTGASGGIRESAGATVLDLREADGVMRVRLGESACEIEVPLGYATSGNRVQVAVRAGDILLATEVAPRIERSKR